MSNDQHFEFSDRFLNRFAFAFRTLCILCGWDKDKVITIFGETKGYTESHDEPTDFLSHCWIFIELKDGTRRFVDPCWGAGYVHEGVFHRCFDDFYFLCTKDDISISHFSLDTAHQTLPKESWSIIARPCNSFFAQDIRFVNILPLIPFNAVHSDRVNIAFNAPVCRTMRVDLLNDKDVHLYDNARVSGSPINGDEKRTIQNIQCFLPEEGKYTLHVFTSRFEDRSNSHSATHIVSFRFHFVKKE